MQQAHYLNRLCTTCCEHQFGQDAIEWAVLSGWITLTYILDLDMALLMDAATGDYDRICAAYHAHCRQMEAAETLHQLAA